MYDLTRSASPADLPALPDWPDLTPLWWVAGGLGGGFLLILLFLTPIAVFANGRAGENARALFRQILGLFHAALTARRRQGRDDHDGQS